MQAYQNFAFGGSQLARAAELRSSPDGVSAILRSQSALVVPLWRGKPLLKGSEAGWLPPGHAALESASDTPILLGVDGDRAYFAVDITEWVPENADLPVPGLFNDATEQHHPALGGDYRFAELRGVLSVLDPRDAGLIATAKALLGWHQSHRFCSACGEQSQMIEAGWQRRCPACGASHFPRTDPVVIMLVTRGNRTLVGRSPGWPEGMYSCLAGFVEPGETLEDAVRREVAEETGVRVGPVRYVSSQPWPFPSSLMIGCQAEAESEEITLDPAELEAAVWLSREEMAQIFVGDNPAIRAPRRGAIAGALLANWLADSTK